MYHQKASSKRTSESFIEADIRSFIEADIKGYIEAVIKGYIEENQIQCVITSC